MQLILNSDIDTGLQSKMSTIEQKSLDQKFDHAALIENLIKDYESHEDGNKSNEKPTDPNNEIQNENGVGDSAEDKEILFEGDEISKDVSNSEENNDNSIEIDVKSPKEIEGVNNMNFVENEEVLVNNVESVEIKEKEENNEQKENACETDNIKEEKSLQLVMSCDAKIVEQNEEQFNSVEAVESDNHNVSMEVVSEKHDDVMEVEPPYLIHDCDNEVVEVVNTNTDDKTSHINTENEDVINILDERDDDGVSAFEKQNILQETIKEHDNQESDVTKSNNEDQDTILDKVISSKNISNNLGQEDVGNFNVIGENKLSIEISSEETIKLIPICKLSNTLDILSDDEDELLPKDEEKEPQKENVGDGDKLCINIDDDDDIMLVDEASTPIITNDEVEEKNDENDNVNECCKEVEENNITQDINETSPTQEETLEKDSETTINIETKEIEEEQELEARPVTPKPKPLLPTNFLKTCKKNLAEMTRDELEQFCIMKIVEGVVDRSNLAEIKTQLKTMAQNLDEFKKKTQMISKQNRDLQVVLISVQEEQKKRPELVINPLKITRSVGMQVLMGDKNSPKKKTPIGPNINKQIKSNSLNKKKAPMIPVPRLVPASNNIVTNKSPTAKQSSSSFSNGVSVKSSPPVQKSEKRSHSKMQQNNPDTVDLTDDEPPNKQPQRHMNPPIRLVPPQNLMATPRQAFTTNINSPRKVYIPISGSQTQNVRPGQTFMLKAIAPQQGARQRMTSSMICKQPSNLRMSRQFARHPAPLPEPAKQFEPPNWKSLPPAPELKLSKVENGIVISWKIDGFALENYEEVASFQLYAYQETSLPPNTSLWKKIGDVKALPLPMACTLTQFMAGYKYYFAVRAIDVKSRVGPFSEPGSILLLNKM